MLILSMSISFTLTPIFSRIAQRFDFMDRPNSRKLHEEATPLLGGAAVFIAFLTSITMNRIFSTELTGIIVAGGGLFAIGVIDDFKGVQL